MRVRVTAAKNPIRSLVLDIPVLDRDGWGRPLQSSRNPTGGDCLYFELKVIVGKAGHAEADPRSCREELIKKVVRSSGDHAEATQNGSVEVRGYCTSGTGLTT